MNRKNIITAEKLVLTDEWDKVFPLSDEVNHRFPEQRIQICMIK